MIGGPRKRAEQNLAYSPRVASGEREEVKRKSEKGKYTIALKEANETRYWLELLAETDYLPTCDQTASVLDECKSLIAILAASVKTAKGEK